MSSARWWRRSRAPRRRSRSPSRSPRCSPARRALPDRRGPPPQPARSRPVRTRRAGAARRPQPPRPRAPCLVASGNDHVESAFGKLPRRLAADATVGAADEGSARPDPIPKRDGTPPRLGYVGELMAAAHSGTPSMSPPCSSWLERSPTRRGTLISAHRGGAGPLRARTWPPSVVTRATMPAWRSGSRCHPARTARDVPRLGAGGGRAPRAPAPRGLRPAELPLPRSRSRTQRHPLRPTVGARGRHLAWVCCQPGTSRAALGRSSLSATPVWTSPIRSRGAPLDRTERHPRPRLRGRRQRPRGLPVPRDSRVREPQRRPRTTTRAWPAWRPTPRSWPCACSTATAAAARTSPTASPSPRTDGADVINLSLGGPGPGQPARPGRDMPAARNTMIVAAAGNENNDNDVSPTTPCNLPQASLICVAPWTTPAGSRPTRTSGPRAWTRRTGR